MLSIRIPGGDALFPFGILWGWDKSSSMMADDSYQTTLKVAVTAILRVALF